MYFRESQMIIRDVFQHVAGDQHVYRARLNARHGGDVEVKVNASVQEICRNILGCKRSNVFPLRPLGREMEYPLLEKDVPCRKGSGDANRGRKHSMPDAGDASWAAYVLVPVIIEKAASPPTARATRDVQRIRPADHAPPASHPLCNAS
jgi:hypothetical protein